MKRATVFADAGTSLQKAIITEDSLIIGGRYIDEDQDMNLHYVINLWEPAAPAFCSFSKPYVGNKKDLLKVAAKMQNADPQSETAKAIQEYFNGNHGATHNIAYREVPILTPVRVLACSTMRLPDRTWEHINAWGYPYKMKFDSADVSQIIIRFEGKYHRFIKARFAGFCHEGIKGDWQSVGFMLFGNAEVIEANDEMNTFENLLYVKEDTAKNKQMLKAELDDPRNIVFDRICDEIFGDG